jgi:hypothetical protein
VRRGAGEAGDPGRLPAVEDGDVLGERHLADCPRQSLDVRVLGVAVDARELGPREREVGARLDQDRTLRRRADTPSTDAPATASVRPSPVGGARPAVRAGEVYEPAGSDRRSELSTGLVLNLFPAARRSGPATSAGGSQAAALQAADPK